MTSTAKDFFLNNNFKAEKGSTNGFKYSMENDNLSQELQFKMSKKIAQLTKVIYALNTRNDDNETIVNELEFRHKREIQDIGLNFKEKLENLETRLKFVEKEKENVEKSGKSFEIAWKQVKKEFDCYKDNQLEIINQKDKNHMEHIQLANNQIKSLKFSYEDLWRNLEDLQDKQMKNLKNLAEKMEKEKEIEIELLKREFIEKESHLKDLIGGSQKQVENEFQKAQDEIKELKSLKSQITVEFNAKLFEKTEEIMNLKQLIQEYEKKIGNLQLEFELKLTEKSKLHEFELDEVNIQLRDAQALINNKEKRLKEDLNDMVKELKLKDETIRELEKKMKNLSGKQEDFISNQQKNLEKKVSDEIEKCKKLESELGSKNRTIIEMEKKTEKLQKTLDENKKELNNSKAEIEKLQEKLMKSCGDVKDLKRQLQIMNEERHEMTSCTKSVEVDYEIQIQTLTRGLEEMQKERGQLRSEMDKVKMNNELEMTSKINQLQKQSENELEKMAKKFEKELKLKESNRTEEMRKIKEDGFLKVEEERKKSSKMIEKLKSELEQMKAESNSKIKVKDKEISDLNASIQEKEKEIKSLNLQLKSLKDSNSDSKKIIGELNSQLGNKTKEIEALQEEIRLNKEEISRHKSAVEKAKKSIRVQEDMSEKYNKLSSELDLKWADTMRKETGRIRNELLESFGKEKQKLIASMNNNKSQALDELKDKLRQEEIGRKNDEDKYILEISTLEARLDFMKEEMMKNHDDKTTTLNQKIDDMRKCHVQQLEQVKAEHSKELDRTQKEAERQKVNSLQEMSDLLEETERGWRERHDTALRNLVRENERLMNIKLDEMESKHNREINEILKDRESELNKDKSKMEENLNKEIQSLKNKIQIMEKQIQSENSNHQNELDKVSSAKVSLTDHQKQLQNKLTKAINERDNLAKQVADLNQDLTFYSRNMDDKVKQKETELKRYYEQIIEKNKYQYEENCKQTLVDFTTAQNLFKDKIKELSNKLIDTEAMLKNRPPRDEDREIIETLEAQLRSCEKEIERLTEDKKYFQLELVNRETNFNKVFATPNTVSNKSRRMSNEKMKSNPKLVPLPGSPFHDEPFNSTKPLSNRLSIDATEN